MSSFCIGLTRRGCHDKTGVVLARDRVKKSCPHPIMDCRCFAKMDSVNGLVRMSAGCSVDRMACNGSGCQWGTEVTVFDVAGFPDDTPIVDVVV
jgi:hypothetical protein